ncbi:BTAD domain-containing putative transcriptional regulator [Streptomyces sp. NPDC007808]|uniref:BTAD domain-containing putative transcriptional regulator n=1 Tax=Streptomyces sp. NPDC007808 TaxID=3364779 RepID=UPI0036A51875
MTTAVTGIARQAVRIRFFGDFELTVNGAPVRRWRAGKARGLFQFLVIHRGQTLTRERLYEALWPGSDRCAGDSSLKVAAHALRRVLDAHPDSPCASGIRLSYRDFGYVLDVADLWSDVDRFRELVHSGLRAAGAGDRGAARERLRSAVALYAGEFLRGESADWVVEQREYLRSLALRALQVLRADAVEREDFPELIEVCRSTLGIDRHHEETYRALMTAHGRLGEHACVRRWYDLCARRLREDLAVAPSRETDRLLHAILPAALPPATAPAERSARVPAAPGWSATGLRPRPLRRARPDARGGARPGVLADVARPDLRGDVRPDPHGEVRSDPRGGLRPDPRGDVRPDLRGDVRPEVLPATRSDARGDLRPDPRGGLRPDPHRDVRPDPRGDLRPEVLRAARSDARGGNRRDVGNGAPVGTRPEAGADARPEVRAAARPGDRAPARFEVRTGLRPDGRSGSRTDAGPAVGTGGRTDARRESRGGVGPETRREGRTGIGTDAGPDVGTGGRTDARRESRGSVGPETRREGRTGIGADAQLPLAPATRPPENHHGVPPEVRAAASGPADTAGRTAAARADTRPGPRLTGPAVGPWAVAPRPGPVPGLVPPPRIP